jgi:hypothetical protein
MIMNGSTFKEFQRLTAKPLEVIEHNKRLKGWVYLSSSILIVVAFVPLLSGFNIMNYIELKFGMFLLFLTTPILVVNRYDLYLKPGK